MTRPRFNRRQMLAALAAAAGCDVVDVKIKNTGGLEVTEDGGLMVPPITSNDDFYVYTCCFEEAPDPDTWKIRIGSNGDVVGSVDKDWLDAHTPVEVELTLQCIGSTANGKQIGNAVWSGLPLREVLDELGVVESPAAVEIMLRGHDDYHASIPVGDLDAESPVWLIWKMNGEDLPVEHGGPARLMTPNRYGIKNVKWVTRIELLDEVHQGFWDLHGQWSHTAEYLPMGYTFSPFNEEEVSGDVEIIGVAFAGGDPITRVELTFDGGKTFQEAAIDYAPGPDIWTTWSFSWAEAPQGTYNVMVRVTTEDGRQNQLSTQATDRKQGFDGTNLIRFTVA